jgi:ribosomal protein L11 methylase PrmA
MPHGAVAFEAARSSGVLNKLADAGLLLPSIDVDARNLPGIDGAAFVIEHPALAFVSYPYEWCFSAFRDAALLHLDLHLAALENSFTLSDASAYNVQFVGTRPVFIDHLSIVPYHDGMIWEGHRQFCAHFLNPLILWSKLRVPPNAWLRGSLEGIGPEELAPMLRARDKLSWTVMAHVIALAALNKRQLSSDKPSPIRRPHLSKNALLGMLGGLRRFIARLPAPHAQSVWGDYAGNTSYSTAEAATKHAVIAEMVTGARAKLLYDLGCNTGDYSQTALDAGAVNVIGFDFDHMALEQAYARFSASNGAFLPLWMDASNPSPSQGWAQQERKGLAQRGPADALIALAIVHHLAIGRNVPLAKVVEWLMSLAPVGVIEFPAKTDSMVKQLLANRQDIFADYNEEVFLNAIRAGGSVEKMVRLPENGRLLVTYARRGR